MRSRASSSRLGGAAAAGRRRRVLFQDSGSGLFGCLEAVFAGAQKNKVERNAKTSDHPAVAFDADKCLD
jgi:hypothetical protein